MRDETALEERLRAALRDEVGEVWPPPSLWPRLQAALAQPAAAVPAAVRPRAELRALVRRGDPRGLVLALLAEREMDAFTLARRAEDIARGMGAPGPTDGALLPALHRLEAEGALDARWRPGPHGPRRAYTLSARGRRARRRLMLVWRAAGLGAQLRRLIPHRVSATGTGGR